MTEVQRGDDVVSVELPAPASWKKLVLSFVFYPPILASVNFRGAVKFVFFSPKKDELAV